MPNVLASGNFNNHRYDVVNVPNGWDAAINAATTNGGYLVTINSSEENDFVFQLASNFNRYVLLGARVNSTSTGYEWITGEPFSYQHWYSGEPEDVQGAGVKYERYVAFAVSSYWGDFLDGGAPSSYYVFEYNINTSPTGTVTLTGNPSQGETLTATNTLADADGLGTITYQWLQDNSIIAGVTGSTYTLTSANVGKTISVQAAYTDGGGTTESVTSAPTAPVTVPSNPGVTFSNATSLVTTEAGGTATFEAVLTLQPRQDVRLTLTFNDATEGQFQATQSTSLTLTFTASNWNLPQTVTLVGVDDKTNDGEMASLVQTSVLSDDLRYDGMRSGMGLPIPNLVVINLDNDQPDELYGDAGGIALSDYLVGGDGPSDVYGKDGRDELYGGNGDDRLYGGYGDDVLHGDADNDEVEGEQGNDRMYGDAGDDTLTGGTGRDTLAGGDGSDVLDGSSDADAMDGGNGADTYYMDNAADVINDGGTDGSVDSVYVTAFLNRGYTLGTGIDNATLDTQARNAALTGNTGNNALTGNAANNALTGGAGNDTLNGGAGQDTLNDGAGNDSLNGGEGNDQMVAGSAGSDRYVGGNGTDGIQYTSTTISIDINLTTGRATGSSIGNDTLTQIENAIGGASGDTLTGSTGNNLLDGANGNDSIAGGAGNDTLTGGVGRDTLFGGTSNDIFDFNAPAETGTTSANMDMVSDFTPGQDRIDLSGIDADQSIGGNQSFSAPVVGGTFSGAFANPGDLYFDATAHILYGNIDTNAAPELAIQLSGVSTLNAENLIL